MKIIILFLGLLSVTLALPSRRSSHNWRFPAFDNDDRIYEIEIPRSRSSASERFRNVPVVYIEEEENEQPSNGRNSGAGESSFSSSLRNRVKNIPLVFLQDEDDSASDDFEEFSDVGPLFENDDDYDIEEVYIPPSVAKHVQKTLKKPTNDRLEDDSEEENVNLNVQTVALAPPRTRAPAKKPNRQPVRPIKPTRKPTRRPVKPAEESVSLVLEPVNESFELQNKNVRIASIGPDHEIEVYEHINPNLKIVKLGGNLQSPKPTEQTPKAENHNIEVYKNGEKIEIPIPRSLEIVAFITKDGAIYEIDNEDENVLLLEKNAENGAALKSFMEKSLQRTVNKVLIENQKSAEELPETAAKSVVDEVALSKAFDIVEEKNAEAENKEETVLKNEDLKIVATH